MRRCLRAAGASLHAPQRSAQVHTQHVSPERVWLLQCFDATRIFVYWCIHSWEKRCEHRRHMPTIAFALGTYRSCRTTCQIDHIISLSAWTEFSSLFLSAIAWFCSWCSPALGAHCRRTGSKMFTSRPLHTDLRCACTLDATTRLGKGI